MNQLHSRAIVLSRTDYGEADRILTMLTPEQGKLRLMARGVRRQKSKLAGGIELFSVSDISYMHGRGEIGTLISTRLINYYSHIVQDIGRVQLGYELIKNLNKATEDQPEPDYFDLLERAFQALDDPAIGQALIRLWFSAQLLQRGGHQPNLQTTLAGEKLAAGEVYNFDYDDVSFAPHPAGSYTTDDIKFLRLSFSSHPPKILQQIQDSEALVAKNNALVQTMLQTYIRL